jgi:hypothetical protein
VSLFTTSGAVAIAPAPVPAPVAAPTPARAPAPAPMPARAPAPVPVQAQLPNNLQAVIPRMATAAAAVPNPRLCQQALPLNYQAAAPHSRHREPINDAPSSSINATASTSSSSTMTLSIKRGIPHRTCFALEFSPPPEQLYLTVKSFVDDNLVFLRDSLLEHAPPLFKVHMSVETQFNHATDSDKSKKWHISTAAEKGNREALDDYFNTHASSLDEKLANYSERGSGWKVVRLLRVSLVVSEYSELCRLSGHGFVPTHPMIHSKKCVINVQNTDNLCFVYAILSILKRDVIRKQNRHMPAKYQRFLNELNYDPATMPMQLVKIPKFEKKNPHLAINVIKFNPPDRNRIPQPNDDAEVFKHPCFDLVYRSKQFGEGVQPIYLLLVDGVGGNFHYMGVKNLESLLNCNRNQDCDVQIRNKICLSCLRMFSSQPMFDKHQTICASLKVSGTVYQKPLKPFLEFDQWSKSISPKFVVYADFESVLERPQNDDDTSRILQVHLPIAAACLTLGPNDGNRSYHEFYGPNCAVEFMRYLGDLAAEVYEWYELFSKHPMNSLCEVAKEAHRAAFVCYLCKKPFDPLNNRNKVCDHDHFTGETDSQTCLAGCISQFPRLRCPSHSEVCCQPFPGLGVWMYRSDIRTISIVDSSYQGCGAHSLYRLATVSLQFALKSRFNVDASRQALHQLA